MKSLTLPYIPVIEIIISLMIILLPLSNSNELMNGVQTAKSFNFFYVIFALVAIAVFGFLFTKGKQKLSINAVDVLLLAFVAWVIINKYLLHGVHSLSLRYFELLGLVVLYIIIRTLNTKYTIYLLLAMCISGAVQAVYGCLQLWGYSPSHHGLFKMTGSFFNPGPYAGYLCGVLPLAVGLYWMTKEHREHGGDTEEHSETNSKKQKTNAKLAERNDDAFNKDTAIRKLILIISTITIISILLVLPAARSRAAWLGAMAGVAYLAWHKYNIGQKLKRQSHQTLKLFKHSYKIRNWIIYTIVAIMLIAGSLILYHYKKGSADGRLLIWTVTANMIKDNPLLGLGQDMFKAHYMDYQADYFRTHPDSKFEQVANDNNYVFNEFLKMWVENGIVGLLILMGGFVVLFLGHRVTQGKNINSGELCVTKLLKASLLAIMVFGLFAYPGEILPIKIVAITCLGLLANYLALNISNTSEASIEREQSEHQTAQRCEASNGEAKPETWNLKLGTPVKYASNVAFYGVNLKPVIAVLALSLVLIAYKRTNELKLAYITWNDAFDLYNYGLYDESLEDYKKALPVVQHNGDFMLNYGKALSIAEKHTKAVTILEQAKSYQSNSVLYTALGDSYKALEKYKSAEQQYSQATSMAPAKFYPLYLQAKLYDASGQQQKALAMANTILNKEVKVHSTAIEEIKEEMKTIITK